MPDYFYFIQGLCLLGVGVFVLLIAIFDSKANKSINKRIDNIHDRLLKLEYPQPKKDAPTIEALQYRMDILEGKHLRARNLGIGLPQPRSKETNGE